MDGFIKKSLSKILLSLFLVASAQNLNAMQAGAPVAQNANLNGNNAPAAVVIVQQPAQQPNVVINNQPVAAPVQVQAQNRYGIKAIFRRLNTCLKGCWWTIKFPFIRMRPFANHFLKMSKELGLTALHCAEIIAYLYALDCFLYYMTPAASDFANFIHLSQWSPECLKNFFTVIAQHYKAGNLSTFINSIGYKIYDIYKTGGSFSPTALFCSAPIVCPACPAPTTCPAPEGCWLF